MRTIELYIDEDNEFGGIEAISIVENPAIEEDFIALNSHEVKLAEVDTEKRILMGAALIPNKKYIGLMEKRNIIFSLVKIPLEKLQSCFYREVNKTIQHWSMMSN